MSNDIRRSTPEDARNDARRQRKQRAAGILADCSSCGLEGYASGLTATKDGRTLCSSCFAVLLDAAFEAAESEGSS